VHPPYPRQTLTAARLSAVFPVKNPGYPVFLYDFLPDFLKTQNVFLPVLGYKGFWRKRNLH
jgi:hypothetical protein